MMDEEIMQKDTMHLNYLNNRFMFIGFLGHFLWIFLFLGLGIYLISFINFLSASIYIIGLFLNKKGYTFMGIAIGHIEILIHAIVITVLLGPHMGFQYIY